MLSFGTKGFKDLAGDYGNFAVPAYEILVEKSKLSVKRFPVLSISVNQSIGASSSAQISFACPFDMGTGQFEKGLLEPDVHKKLAPGSQIEIKLGYASGSAKPETVFSGLIGAASTEFSASGVIVNVTCYDAMALLFFNVHWRSFKQEAKVAAVVKQILEPCAKYCKLSIGVNDYDASIDPNDAIKWVQDYIDDYKFVMRLATITNSSFYSCDGTLYFTKNIAENDKAGVSLGWGSGLMSFSVDIDSSNQIGSVSVSYRDSDGKDDFVYYDGRDIAGKGELANKTNDMVAHKEQEATEIMVKNKTQAETLAKSMFLSSAIKYVTAKGSTIGLPYIRIGDAIEIKGVSDKLSGKYVLTKVTHQYDAGGFLTNFTCQRAKI